MMNWLLYSAVVDNASDGNLFPEIEADIAEVNSSEESAVAGVSSDEDVEQDEDIWLRADTTPPPASKTVNSEGPMYDGTFY